MTGGIDYDYQDRHRDARVPEPAITRRSSFRRISTILTGLFTVSLLLAFGVGAGFVYLESVLDSAGPLETEKTVLIDRGEGSRVIAEKLHSEGVVSDDTLFLIGLLAHKANGRLKAGEYKFDARITMREIMDKLVAGKSVQYKITIPEGLTSQQIVERVREDEILVGELETDVPEGSLLPDTYNFTRGTTRQEVIDRMRAAQGKLLQELWPTRSPDLPISDPTEAVILASIVEKETGLETERRRVAGVFVNRLKRSMRLQSDPTIVYGLVGGKGPLGRPITKADLSQRTEYNTYQIDGLPPTPIANPGRAAIEAALNPADTRDLYFVADGSGGHAFAETLAEHNENVNRWRELQRSRNEPGSVEAPDASNRDDDAPDQTAALQPPSDTDASETSLESDPSSDTAEEPSSADDESLSDDDANADLDSDADATESTSLENDEPAQDDTDLQNDTESDADTETSADSQDDADAQDSLADADEPVAPQSEEQTEVDREPDPEPATEPERRPAISEIAKAIIENSPAPKPKPGQRTSTVEPTPAPDDIDTSQIQNEPVPEAPDADVTDTDTDASALVPQTPPQPVAPSPTDLR